MTQSRQMPGHFRVARQVRRLMTRAGRLAPPDVTRAARRSPLGPLGMTHLKNNDAPANGRGCVADASHVS
ncbi:MAG: hypothetical protein WA624_14505 [Methylocella sp.]